MSQAPIIPEPSKRPFGWPLPAAALDYFVHPVQPGFRVPLRHPEDGMVYCAGAFGALRTRRFAGAAEEYPPIPAEMVARLDALPWDALRTAGQQREAWRLMDDSRGTLFRDPPLSLYVLRDFRWHLTREKLVRVAGGPIVPLALLQLISRLPRVEIHARSARVASPLFFRFNGEGEIIVPHLGHVEGAAFELFKDKSSGPLLPGGL